MTCEEFEQLSGAYVLDAATPAEMREAEAHLATCAKCTRLMQELRGVVTLLPLSVNQVNPSPALKERIFTALQQEKASPSAQPAQFRPPAKRRSWRPRILVAAAVLMLCLLGGMTTWNISLYNQVGHLRQQVDLLSQRPAGPLSYQVKGMSVGAGAMGQLLYFPAQGITVLMINGLPQLQGVHVYQGWLLHTKGKNITGVKSIGLLNTANGSASLSFKGDVTGYNATAISLESGPTPTPNAPKGEVVALGALK
jgi:anti-sigma-K factor RskA